ncbi:FecR family protein [Echinicola salinicaeni]|uniref:FecR family protein n=1 Tax=Echinicola salinicaeni TaxID=2762757 RepID=UPI0016471830|nr:FecR domain-containing protein [Echinicola salinicaeni]
MNKETFELAGLIERFLQKKTSKEEEERLFFLLEKEEYKGLLDYYKKADKVQEKLDFMEGLDVDKAWENVSNRKKRNAFHSSLLKYAAVLVIGLIGLGYGLFYNSSGLFTDFQGDNKNNLFMQSSDHVILSLSDGREIPLTSKNISIKDGEDFFIEGNDQKVSFIQLNPDTKSKGLYQLRVPAQKNLAVTFTDGTEALINAQSQLSFSPDFSSHQRKVVMQGEAFFEVTHDPNRPFIVEAESSLVEVLGTKFNVKSFFGKTNTVLVEGKVKFSQNGQKEILKPGEGAVADGFNLKKTAVDMTQVLAWKNNMFLFEKAALSEVFREIGRWYGVKVSGEMKKLKENQFSGKISRETPLDQVLMIIQDVSPVKLQLKDKTIKVMVMK